MNNKLLTFLFIGIFCMTLISAHWWDSFHWFHEEEDEEVQALTIQSPGKEWNVIKATGTEANLTFWALSKDIKKAELGWIVPNGCSGWEDKYLFDNESNIILDDKDKAILLKCESSKCSGEDCYYISLISAKAINIDDNVKLGNESIVSEYQDINTLNYNLSWANCNLTLYKNISGTYDNTVNSIWINYNNDSYKFGANDSSLGENETAEYKYEVKCDVPIYRKGNANYIKNPIKIKTPSAQYTQTHEFNFNDVCKRMFNPYNVTIDNETWVVYNTSANCQFDSYNVWNRNETNNETNITTQFYDYYYEIDFISDSDIDPEISIGSSDWILTSLFKNVTAEIGDSNHSHLNVSSVAPYDSLVGYWAFDGDLKNVVNATVYDWSGNNSDGVMVGDAVVNSSGGKYGDGLVLDGTGDYVDFGANYNLSIGQSMSIGGWVKTASSATNVFSAWHSSANYPAFYLQFSTTRPIMYFGSGQYRFFNASAVTTITDGNWHHVMFTWDGVADLTGALMYVDGISVPPDTTASIVTIAAQDKFSIPSPAITGVADYDEVMIFDTNLSAQQITDIYNNQSARFKYQGSQKVRAVNIEQSGGFNRVNLSTSVEENMGSSVDVRLGQINHDVDLSGLVGYWPFEWGSAVDISGEGNDGSIVDDTYWNESGGVNESGGFSFDGAGDWIDIQSPDSDLLEGVPEFSISIWLQTDLQVGANHRPIGQNNVFLFGWSNSQRVTFTVHNTTGGSGQAQTSAANQLIDGLWHHAVGVYNGTTVLLYLDGVDGGTQDSLTGVTDSEPKPIQIGSEGRGDIVVPWNGSIDEVMIFNRSLSASEISTLYNNQVTKYSSVYYGDYQGVVSGENATFSVSKNVDFVFADYRFNAGNSSSLFYSPIMYGDIGGDIVAYGVEDVVSPEDLLKNVTAEVGDNNHTHLSVDNVTTPYDSLVGYWSFDGDLEDTTGATAYDWSGEGNDGVMGADAVVNSSGGKFGEGLVLDGTGDTVLFSDTPVMTNLTIGFWINPDSVTDDKYVSDFGGVNEFAILLGYQDGFYNAYGGDYPFGTSPTASQIPASGVGIWDFLVWTKEGTTLKGYLNGIENVSGTITHGDFVTSAGFRLGGRYDNLAQSAGQFDEVMIFNSSLTAQQIQDIYNNQSARFKGTGSQKVRAVNIEQDGSLDRVNLSIAIEENLDSRIEARVGMINSSVNLSGLVGYWPFEWGSAVDISGNSNDGTLVDDTYWNESGGVNETGGFEFDGDGDWIDVGDNVFNYSSSKNWTFIAWVYRNTNGNFNVIFGGGDAEVDTRFFSDDDSKDEFSIYDNSNSRVMFVGTQFTEDKWHMVTITRENSTNLRLYIDDGDEGTGDTTNSGTHTIENLGANQAGNGGWDGSIDEVMIFNRSLSATEISDLYSNQSAKFNNIYYTDYQNITSNVNSTFEISTEADFVLPDYKFWAGTASSNFYSPIILGDADLSIFASEVGEDTTSPTWSNNATNSTIANQSTNFSILWNDNTALHPLGQYIFSTNNTGVWVNDSAINFTSTPQSINVIKVLNSTVGNQISWRWYVNDTAGNVNITTVFNLITTAAVADTCTCAGLDTNWEIDHTDACTINDDCNLGTGTLSFINTGTTICNASINTTDMGDPGTGGKLEIDSNCIIYIFSIIGLLVRRTI